MTIDDLIADRMGEEGWVLPDLKPQDVNYIADVERYLDEGFRLDLDKGMMYLEEARGNHPELMDSPNFIEKAKVLFTRISETARKVQGLEFGLATADLQGIAHRTMTMCWIWADHAKWFFETGDKAYLEHLEFPLGTFADLMLEYLRKRDALGNEEG